MKNAKIILYVLAAICFVLTVIDTIHHHSLNIGYTCAVAADLCAASLIGRQEEPPMTKRVIYDE